MVALRRLGRGLVLDDVGELADLSTSTVDWIFHTSVDGMVDHYFNQFVGLHTGDRRKKAMQVYQMLGSQSIRGL
jgi:hypothetical protein